MTINISLDTLLITVVTSITATGILGFALRAWLKTAIRHEYDRELEAYKSELKTAQDLAVLNIQTSATREAAFQSAAHASFAEGQKASMERKLNAIDRLWSSTIKLRNTMPTVLGFIDILTVEEYGQMSTDPRFRALTEDLSPEKISSFVGEDLEDVRPYVGEYLWAVYFCYRAILLRILYLLYLGRTDAERMEWHKDSGTRQLMSVVLTGEEMSQFDAQRSAKVMWLKQRIESKMLVTAQNIISGKSFGAESLEQARTIQQRIASVTADRAGIIRMS